MDLAAAELHRGLSKAGIWCHRRKDGSELDVEITAHDHVFDGRAARVVLALDVTERVEAERRCVSARLATATCSRTRAT